MQLLREDVVALESCSLRCIRLASTCLEVYYWPYLFNGILYKYTNGIILIKIDTYVNYKLYMYFFNF